MEIQFFMPMLPPTVTAQEHKVTVVHGKPKFYDPPEVADAKDKLISALSQHCPDQQFCDAVRLVVKWLFPISGSHRSSHRNGEYKTTRPDTDNLQKMLKDCMTKCGFWKDDALVVSEIVEKFWSDIPGIWIRIEDI